MELRSFGNTDLQVSAIGFGAWAIGGNAMIGDVAIGWGPSDDDLSSRAIRTALDQGILFFDTADIYGLGHSENLLGKALKDHQEVVIATKVGNCAKNGLFTVDYSYDYIIEACEASLKRLNREVIDYYQLHSARLTHLEQGDCIAAMHQLKQEGKIRYWGLSLNTFTPEPEAQWIMERHEGSGFQLVLNLMNGKALPLMRMAAQKGYGIIVRMPLQFGLLTGKMKPDRHFGPDDHRHKRLDPILLQEATQYLENHVWPICQNYQCTPLQLALAYLLSFPEVSTVIPGLRSPQQVEENSSGLFRLDLKDRDYLEQLFQSAPGQAIWHDLVTRG